MRIKVDSSLFQPSNLPKLSCLTIVSKCHTNKINVTRCGVLLAGVDTIDGRASHVPRQVDVDGGHDAQDDARLENANEVCGALALVAGHELLPRLGDEDVDVSEEGAEDASDDAHEDGGEDSNDVDGDQVLGSELGLEETEVVLVLEAVERRVEQVGGEGCSHAAEEHLPRKFVLPE